VNLSETGFAVRYLAVRSARNVPENILTLARKLKARLVRLGETALDTQLVWITVPDDKIEAIATRLAPKQKWDGKVVFHSSGALTSDALEALRKAGASVASVHPAMTFVKARANNLNGVPFTLEGDKKAEIVARRVVEALGGTAYRLKKEDKILYHAFTTLASPMLVALLAVMEEIAQEVGIKREEVSRMSTPLLMQTFDNYLKFGVREAFTGPLARGDASTVRKHVGALEISDEARAVYIALGKAALKLLLVKNRAALQRAMDCL
jgi:predicted short-subunit dehydrogenase-like oxidoreductase (DUF2520 family)